ncbi:MAG TPA: hypothetical protein VFG79_20505 [Solirubrobacter sp.]|nr:hypothetical protein [Solirubrobacter sp.]
MADGVIKQMRVDTSLLDGITAVQQAAHQAPAAKLKDTETAFSSALKSATASEKETTKPVPGKGYAEILTGPRAGLYLNTSGGTRDGQAFILVKHDGREDHIYGTGRDRKVVSVGGDKKSDAEESSTDRVDGARATERTRQVDGRAYVDILNGPRSGMFINTSGNARDGEAFVLVKRDGREYHIYGTGKDREVIGLKPRPDADDAGKKTSDTPPASSAPNTGATPTGTLVTNNPS